ncbi:MAG: lipoyl(octanoyl) transferase LipB [Flavobacteriaceae bacterium]
MKPILKVEYLGRMKYKAAWEYQEALFQQTVDLKVRNRREQLQLTTSNYVLFVEHDPVYTLGKSGDFSNLLVSEAELERKGAEFFKTNRGGDITFHGPGQLVAYPILDLDHFFTDVHKYLRFLEEAVIQTLAHWNIEATRSSGETGVWIDVGTPFARKICAMGIRASRWVTMHGLALNVDTDLSFFELMIPCGIQGKGVTSMKRELGDNCPNLQQVQQEFLKQFVRLFDCELA